MPLYERGYDAMGHVLIFNAMMCYAEEQYRAKKCNEAMQIRYDIIGSDDMLSVARHTMYTIQYHTTCDDTACHAITYSCMRCHDMAWHANIIYGILLYVAMNNAVRCCEMLCYSM